MRVIPLQSVALALLTGNVSDQRSPIGPQALSDMCYEKNKNLSKKLTRIEGLVSPISIRKLFVRNLDRKSLPPASDIVVPNKRKTPFFFSDQAYIHYLKKKSLKQKKYTS